MWGEVMTDEELLEMLRNNVGVSEAACRAAREAADRIEEYAKAFANLQREYDARGELIEALVKGHDEAVIKRAAWEVEAKTQQTKNARLRAELEWQASQPEAHPFMAIRARAVLQPAPTVTAGWPTEEGEGSIIVGNVKGDSHD
jgi:multidrug efflux pump subunit AcrB